MWEIGTMQCRFPFSAVDEKHNEQEDMRYLKAKFVLLILGSTERQKMFRELCSKRAGLLRGER